jgi:uncharacterized protein YneF (UPF0154 family)
MNKKIVSAVCAIIAITIGLIAFHFIGNYSDSKRMIEKKLNEKMLEDNK